MNQRLSKQISKDELIKSVEHQLAKSLENSDGGALFTFIQNYKIHDSALDRICDIDLILMHPAFGVYVISVMDLTCLTSLERGAAPFQIVEGYKNILLELLGDYHIDIEARVIFPLISRDEGDRYFAQNRRYFEYYSKAFFKENLSGELPISPFFFGNLPTVIESNDYQRIVEMLLDAPDELKESNEGITVPLITNRERIHFDCRQLGALRNYREGVQVVRGTVGSGKTETLINFVVNKSNRDPVRTFLVLVHDEESGERIHDRVKNEDNVAIELVRFRNTTRNEEFVEVFDEESGWDCLESIGDSEKFSENLCRYLTANPVDYVLIDESQDIPDYVIQEICRQIPNCILFVDEARNCFNHSIDSFQNCVEETAVVNNRPINLTNVYRLPAVISITALSILDLDRPLQQYYRQQGHINSSFSENINSILKEGRLVVDDYQEIDKVVELVNEVKEQEGDDIVVLTTKNTYIEEIEQALDDDQIRVMLYSKANTDRVKTNNLILHRFGTYLYHLEKDFSEVLYKRAYTVLTRSTENLYISLDPRETTPRAQGVVDVIRDTYQLFEDRFTKAGEPTNSLNKKGYVENISFKKSKIAPESRRSKKNEEKNVNRATIIGTIVAVIALGASFVAFYN